MNIFAFIFYMSTTNYVLKGVFADKFMCTDLILTY